MQYYTVKTYTAAKNQRSKQIGHIQVNRFQQDTLHKKVMDIKYP